MLFRSLQRAVIRSFDAALARQNRRKSPAVPNHPQSGALGDRVPAAGGTAPSTMGETSPTTDLHRASNECGANRSPTRVPPARRWSNRARCRAAGRRRDPNDPEVRRSPMLSVFVAAPEIGTPECGPVGDTRAGRRSKRAASMNTEMWHITPTSTDPMSSFSVRITCALSRGAPTSVRAVGSSARLAGFMKLRLRPTPYARAARNPPERTSAGARPAGNAMATTRRLTTIRFAASSRIEPLRTRRAVPDCAGFPQRSDCFVDRE